MPIVFTILDPEPRPYDLEHLSSLLYGSLFLPECDPYGGIALTSFSPM
jgi:hypothetical protein